MKIFGVCLDTLLLFIVIFTGISFANRAKRQLTLRDEATATLESRNNGDVPRTPRTAPPFLPENCGKTFSDEMIVDRPISPFKMLTGLPVSLIGGGSTSLYTINIGGSRIITTKWPWMAVMLVRNNIGALVLNCGGALVTNQHVVTAAHCVFTGRRSIPIEPSRVVVRLGANNITIQNEMGSVDVGVDSIRRHEEYDRRGYRNDIAIMKLRSPVAFTLKVRPLCLPYGAPGAFEDLVGRDVTVIGYGDTVYTKNRRAAKSTSDVLMEAVLEVQSQEVCRRAHEPDVQINDAYLCAGTMDGSKDTCDKDSGGPLMVEEGGRYYLVGIVSAGKPCGTAFSPGVYTRVTAFLDWLTKNLSEMM